MLNSKWIKDLIIRLETIRLLEENVEGKFLTSILEMIVLDLKTKAKTTKANINNRDYIQLKQLQHRKENQQQNEKAAN